jgi:hypothetical protein
VSPGITPALSLIRAHAPDLNPLTASVLPLYPESLQVAARPCWKQALPSVISHNLWERPDKHAAAVLLFAKLPHVSFTNNRAERDLRMSKVKQKVSGCFRKRQYAEAYRRISSYL